MLKWARKEQRQDSYSSLADCTAPVLAAALLLVSGLCFTKSKNVQAAVHPSNLRVNVFKANDSETPHLRRDLEFWLTNNSGENDVREKHFHLRGDGHDGDGGDGG